MGCKPLDYGQCHVVDGSVRYSGVPSSMVWKVRKAELRGARGVQDILVTELHQVDGDAVDKLCKFLHKGFCRGLQALPSRSACASSGWRGSGPAAQKLLTPASTMKWLQQQQQHRSTSRQQLRHSTPARSDPGVQPAATIFGGARRRCQQQRQQCACVLGTQWLCIQLAAADS